MKRDISFYTTASQNLITLHHLRELIERLKKKGPEILFFRGISLLGDVYPQLGDRGMFDVDVLVRQRDIGWLKEILMDLGLEEIEQGVFSKPGFSLDVHTSFLIPIRTSLANSCLTISMDEVFERSITKQLDNIEIMIPCPEHLFISTAIHLQSHSFFGDKCWKDLDRIKRYYQLSDEALFSEAKRMGAEPTLSYLSHLRPELFPSWKQKLSCGERLILKRIKVERSNANFGDLLFLFHSKKKGKALKEIFLPHGISFRIIGNRLWKCLKLLKDALS